MAVVVDLIKRWTLKPDETGSLHPLFGEITGQALPRLLFFLLTIDYATEFL